MERDVEDSPPASTAKDDPMIDHPAEPAAANPPSDTEKK
jgi:hypothetical protein